MRRIDCHILIDPAREASACAMLAQLRAEPVNIQARVAQPGQLTEARIASIRCGSAPLVAWVDDDDQLTPGVFSRLLVELDKHPEACGVFSTEAQVRAGRVTAVNPAPTEVWTQANMLDRHPFVHHVAIMRRSLVERHLEEIRAFPRVGDQLLMWLVSRHGPWLHVPIVGYRWNRDGQQVTAEPGIGAELAKAKEYFRTTSERIHSTSAH